MVLTKTRLLKHDFPVHGFISKVFCAQRGIETMVADHGLGRGQTMG